MILFLEIFASGIAALVGLSTVEHFMHHASEKLDEHKPHLSHEAGMFTAMLLGAELHRPTSRVWTEEELAYARHVRRCSKNRRNLVLCSVAILFTIVCGPDLFKNKAQSPHALHQTTQSNADHLGN